MRSLTLLLLLSVSALAADPAPTPAPAAPGIVELSQVKAAPPKATDVDLIDVGKSRFYKIANYEGPVTYEVVGDAALFKEVEKAITLGVVIQGETEPSYPDVPAGSVILWGKKPGTVDLSAWGVVGGKPKKLLTKSFRVAGEQPRPPPKPDDPVVPDPPKPDGTSPFAEAGNRCLIVFDSGNTTRPAAQNSILYGKAVRDLLNSLCAQGPASEKDGAGNVMREWRIFPANSDVTNVRPVFKNAFAKRGGNDWIMLGDGTTGYSGPLPATEAEAIALIKKHLTAK